jgi:ketosteroid isomerase-like protein
VSQESVETLRRSNASFNRRDRDGVYGDLHPDVEWRDLQHPPDSQDVRLGRP